MTTISVPAFSCSTEEHNDRSWKGETWNFGGVPNTNRYGKYSHAVKPYFGVCANYGSLWYPPGHHSNFAGSLPHWVDLYIGCIVTSTELEGYCSFQGILVFKDLNIPQGAHIVSANMTLYNLLNDAANMGGCWDGWRFKIYAIAEDNFTPFRYMHGSWPVTYLSDYYPPNAIACVREGLGGYIPSSNRVMRESWLWHREHTVAAVPWHWANGDKTYGHVSAGSSDFSNSVQWTTPDISSVIQEIVNRPKWSANNRLCLIIGDDGFGHLITEPTNLMDGPTGYNISANLAFAGTAGIPSQYHPILHVEYS